MCKSNSIHSVNHYRVKVQLTSKAASQYKKNRRWLIIFSFLLFHEAIATTIFSFFFLKTFSFVSFATVQFAGLLYYLPDIFPETTKEPFWILMSFYSFNWHHKSYKNLLKEKQSVCVTTYENTKMFPNLEIFMVTIIEISLA